MRTIKKSIALLIALTMIIGLFSVNVFAEDPSVSLTITADQTDVGQGKEVTFTFTMTSLTGADFVSNNSGLRLTYDDTIVTPEVVSTTTSVSGNINASKKQVNFAHMRVPVTVPTTGLEYCKVKFKLAADAAVGKKALFEIATAAGSLIKDANQMKVDSTIGAIPEVNILKAFTATAVDTVADQTAQLGDKVADIKAKLAALPVVVKGANTDETATLTATWDCAELTGETVTTAGDYTFTGTINGTDVVSVPDTLKATVKVTVGKITLADSMVGTTYKNIEIPQTETASTMDAAAVIATLGDEYKTAKIAKDGQFEEVADVAWAGTGSIDTSVLTSTTASNTMILTGTVTPKADGNYTGTAKTADVTVTVVPAEIKGGSISINNPIDNGYVTANITVPASEVAKMPKIDEDKDDEAAKAAKKAKRTVLVTVESKKTDVEDAKGEYEFTNDDIDKAIAAVTAATAEKPADPITVPAIKVDKKMKELGYSSSGANKTFTVNVTVGGTKLLNGDSKDAVTGEVKKASSGSAPGINKGSSTTTTYAVTVVETKNGTVTVSPEKAASGATVTVKPEPAEGYKVKSVTAVKADGTNVPVDEKAYTFTMPASAVKVTVEFEEGKDEPVNPTPDGKFADVADDFWAAKDIYTLKDAGIIGGKSATEFDPEGDVTRAEFAKMVVGLFGYKATSDAVNFEDCKAEDWFTPYVAAGVEAGVIKGVSDTEFAPNATITREDACTILGRALNKVAASNELKFTDADKVAEYAVPYVALLSELGYVNGYEDGSFAPTNNITRAEAAKIIAGIYNAKDSTEDKADNTDTIDVAPEK